jgi:WD40 repeat protein
MDAMEFEDGGQPLLFSGSLDGTIRLWRFDAASQTFPCDSLEGHVRGVTCLVWIQERGRLYSGSVDKSIKVWEPLSKVCSNTILPPAGGGAAAGGSGLLAAAAAAAASGGAAGAPAGHTDEVHALAELDLSGSTFLVSGAVDGSIKVWDLMANPDVPLAVVELPASTAGQRLLSLGCMSIIPEDGSAPVEDVPVLLCGYEDGTITLRDPQQGCAAIANLRGGKNGGHTKDVRCVYPGPMNTFFSAGNDGKLFAWKYFDV